MPRNPQAGGARYRFKTEPYPHQVEALKLLLRNRGGALFMPMRSGKTKTAIDFVGAAAEKWGDVKRVLVVCPLSVTGVWRSEVRKHLPDKYAGIEWRIINYERLFIRIPTGDGGWTPAPDPDLDEWRADVMILDESHKVGDPSALQSKLAHRYGKLAKYRVIMTGTPIHRKPFALYGQFKFLNDGIFGTRYGAFKKRYGVWGGYGNYQLLRYINLKEMRSKITPLMYHMKHVPERKPTHEIVGVEMPPEVRLLYNEMATESIIEVEDDTITAPIVLTRILRLSQLAGGHIKTDSGEYKTVAKHKDKAFAGLLEQFEDNEIRRVVAFARFIPELQSMVRIAQARGWWVYLLHGGVSESKREQRIAAFNDKEGGKAIFISQVSAGSMGIDLSVADTTVFYSPTNSLIDFDQACARIRKFKDKRPLSYYHILAEGSIDEVIFSSLKAKRDVVEMVLQNPHLLKG